MCVCSQADGERLAGEQHLLLSLAAFSAADPAAWFPFQLSSLALTLLRAFTLAAATAECYSRQPTIARRRDNLQAALVARQEDSSLSYQVARERQLGERKQTHATPTASQAKSHQRMEKDISLALYVCTGMSCMCRLDCWRTIAQAKGADTRFPAAACATFSFFSLRQQPLLLFISSSAIEVLSLFRCFACAATATRRGRERNLVPLSAADARERRSESATREQK